MERKGTQMIITILTDIIMIAEEGENKNKTIYRGRKGKEKWFHVKGQGKFQRDISRGIAYSQLEFMQIACRCRLKMVST